MTHDDYSADGAQFPQLADLYASGSGTTEYRARLASEGDPLNGISGGPTASLDGPVSICPDHGEYSLHIGCLACAGPHDIAPRRAPRLIALTSPAMGSGKSVVAAHLVERHDFRLVKFAGPLKAMTRALLGEAGIRPSEIERMVEGDLKETEIPGLGVTPRRLMQTIGTEWARRTLRDDEEFWVDMARVAVRHWLSLGVSVVIDDMRYVNEMEMVREFGGHCVRIVRPGVDVTVAHSSEGELDQFQMLRIQNNGTLGDLRRKADTLATCPLR
jgi:hypothetical protein